MNSSTGSLGGKHPVRGGHRTRLLSSSSMSSWPSQSLLGLSFSMCNTRARSWAKAASHGRQWGRNYFTNVNITRSSPDLDSKWKTHWLWGPLVLSSSQNYETTRSSSAGGQGLLQRLPKASSGLGCPAAGATVTLPG